MGFPHPTYDVPGHDEALAQLAESAATDPLGHGSLLAAGLRGGDVLAGHLCATAWVFERTGTRTLLVRHRTLGWVEPGGHIEVGEDPGRAAARELREETGIGATPAPRVPALVHAARFPRRGAEPAHHHWNLGYLFVVGDDVPLAGEPGAPLGWFDIAELPSPAVDDLAVVLPVLQALVRTGAQPCVEP